MTRAALVPLGSVARFMGGGTPSKSNAAFWTGDIPWVSPKDMWVDEVVSAQDSITLEAVRSSATNLIPENALLCVVRSGILARKFPVAITGRQVAINQDLKAIIPTDRLDARYLFYFLKASEREVLSTVTTGSTVHRIGMDALKALKIPLPGLEEQRRIVTVLDEAFAAIATATANAEKSLDNARELFEAELREALAEVDGEPATLGTTTDIKVGFAFKSGGYSDDPDDIPLIRGDNVVQGRLRWDDLKRWPKSDADQYDAYRLAVGDLVLAMDRTWVKAGLKYAVIGPDDVPSLLLQRVARLRAKKMILPDFVTLQVASPAFTEYVLGIQTGLGVPHISGKQIADYSFRLPDLKRQSEIVDRLLQTRQASDRLIDLCASKLRSLSLLKQSLLNQAFSGEPIGAELLAA